MQNFFLCYCHKLAYLSIQLAEDCCSFLVFSALHLRQLPVVTLATAGESMHLLTATKFLQSAPLSPENDVLRFSLNTARIVTAVFEVVNANAGDALKVCKLKQKMICMPFTTLRLIAC